MTTFSTMGYIVLALFLFYAINKHPLFRRYILNLALKFIVLGFFTYSAVNFYKSSEFMGGKIDKRLDEQIESYEQGRTDARGRFYSVLASARFIVKRPLLGRGIIEQNKYEEIISGSAIGYGFMGLFMRYGLIIGVLYMFFFYKGFLFLCSYFNMPKSFGFFSFILINMTLLTQVFFFHTPFTFLFILGLLSNKIISRESIEKN